MKKKISMIRKTDWGDGQIASARGGAPKCYSGNCTCHCTSCSCNIEMGDGFYNRLGNEFGSRAAYASDSVSTYWNGRP